MLLNERGECPGIKLTSGYTKASRQLLGRLEYAIGNGHGSFHVLSITLVIL
jgi:hypothetical protein